MNSAITRDPKVESHWQDFFHEWLIRSDTTYLNHGSFGPPPELVRLARRRWIDRLDGQPMDFYLRQLENALWDARSKTAEFVGTTPENLIFAENSTSAMNIVAANFPLAEGDEVLSNNHEYGAANQIWERRCQDANAELRICQLPERFESQQHIVDAIIGSVSPSTRLILISHITSPTALIMPVQAITAAAKEKGIAVCVDGPHALAQVDVNIDAMGCDFYTASCHKWLCGSLGSGFLYVAPEHHANVQPIIKSWGRLLPEVPRRWDEEFTWLGTRDPSAYLSITAAIEFMDKSIGLAAFRDRSNYLAAYAEEMLCDEFGTETIGSRSDGWYRSMAHVPLPNGDHSKLQSGLWNEYGIEVPIIHFDDRWFIRVSCHLYNNTKQLETLRFALRKFLV